MYFGVVLLLTSYSFAQNPDTLWTEIYSPRDRNEPERVLQTADDGYIVVGYSKWISDSNDIWVLKTDQEGNTQWERLIGGSEGDYGESVLTTGDGGYLISATTYNTGSSGSDISFIKLDDMGEIEWEVPFDESEQDWVRESQHTADGGYIHAGATGTYPGMLGLLVKTDSECNTEWYALYGLGLQDTFEQIQQTTDGGYIAAGRTKPTGQQADVYIVKTDSIGNLEWDAVFGDTNYDRPKSIRQTQDGGYIILCTTYNPNTTQWLIKIDSAGKMEWELFSASSDGTGSCLELASDGGFLITGSKNSSLWLCKTDSTGNIEWETTVGASASSGARSFQQTSDDGYIVAGAQNPSSGMLDIWLVKFGPVLGITEGPQPLSDTEIRTVSPNPFSSSLGINYYISQQVQVALSIYDLTGRLVENLENCSVSAGEHTFMWNPDPSLPSSCYLVVLEIYGERYVKRCVKLQNPFRIQMYYQGLMCLDRISAPIAGEEPNFEMVPRQCLPANYSMV